MPVLFASPSRVVVYTDGDTSPETAIPPDLSRVKLDTNLKYVRTISAPAPVTLNLPALARQASGGENPAYFQNHIIGTHGLGYSPGLYGFATIGGAHIPLRGSVPIQISGGNQHFARIISLGSNATNIIINEYAVRNFFAVAANAYEAITVVVTYFITNVNLDA